MKKQLLLGSVLLATISSYSQNGRVKPQPSGVEKMTGDSFNPGKESSAPGSNTSKIIGPAPDIAAGTLSTSATWQKFAGSMNIFGVLVSSSKPLQYQPALNAVSFIHRKSLSYSALPTSNSGAIVAEISTNWGATWDSTCVWSNGTNLARYPQGGIYNPPMNSNLSNAYIVATGPVTGTGGWAGSFYASKQLGTGNYNNTASSAPGAMQFFPNSAPTGTIPGHDHSRYGFTSTDDGKVRSLAALTSDPGGTGVLPGDSAVLLMTGSFNAGSFTWSANKFQPNVIKGSNNSYKMYSSGYMAWNSAGTVGYVMVLGALNTATLANRGYQPIVYKTTNSGASWAMIQGLDFNNAPMSQLRAPLAATKTNSNLEIPYFFGSEGIDLTVDANNKLHIVSTIVGSYDIAADSLNYVYQFTNADGEKYHWPEVNGFRPYIYDFIGDGSTAWVYKTIDSLSSEVPSSSSTGAGYNDNPWDADPANSNAKVSSGSRIQMSRTPDGQYIVYTYAESDTNFTNLQHKWNSLPNVKARCMGTSVYTLSPTKINVTKPVTGPVNPNINARAMFHYVSPLSGTVQAGAAGNGTINVPMTVTNSNPYGQNGNNIHWYSTTKLDFAGLGTYIGINEGSVNPANASLYPNPARGNTTVGLELNETAHISISVLSTMGQVVKTVKTEGHIGQNETNLNLEGLSAGVYLIIVKTNGVSSTKKLIIE